MEIFFVIIFVVGIVIFIVKRNINRNDKSTLKPFSIWLSEYNSSVDVERHLLSGVFLIQSFHLASKMGVISESDKIALSKAIKQENPVQVLSEWLDVALPEVIKFCGAEQVSEISARLVGVYMLICVQGVNPQGDLKRFFAKFAGENLPNKESENNLYDKARELSKRAIISGYRTLGQLNGVAPTKITSDQEIMIIYEKVLSSFTKAAKQRGETLSAGILNTIAWKFLQVNEMLGPEMIDPHLEYEIQKYLNEGLRPDYNKELKLF